MAFDDLEGIEGTEVLCVKDSIGGVEAAVEAEGTPKPQGLLGGRLGRVADAFSAPVGLGLAALFVAVDPLMTTGAGCVLGAAGLAGRATEDQGDEVDLAFSDSRLEASKAACSSSSSVISAEPDIRHHKQHKKY